MTTKKTKNTLGMIGCGNMGTALLQGMLASKLFAPSHVVVYEADAKRAATLKKQFKVRIASSIEAAAEQSVVLLAVKPQQMAEVASQIKPVLSGRSLVISIAAGVSLGWFAKALGRQRAVVRVMPNTPALVGTGMSVLSVNKHVTKTQKALAKKMLGAVGEVLELPERHMDAVTAVSGSGPAYFFLLMENMLKAAKQLKLPEAAAKQLVLQTALGAAQLASTASDAPDVLRKKVTSKGGTTEAALKTFQAQGVSKATLAGVKAAARQSKRLGK